MNNEQKELIHDYLNLDRKIESIKSRVSFREFMFYEQSLCGTTDLNDPNGIRRIAFRVDSRVSDYIDSINMYERNLEANKRRQHYFNIFLSSLDPHTVISLKRRYKNGYNYEEMQSIGHDRIVLEEILEIEEAIGYQFPMILSDEMQREALRVECAPLSEDTVEDSFQTMQKLLGV